MLLAAFRQIQKDPFKTGVWDLVNLPRSGGQRGTFRAPSKVEVHGEPEEDKVWGEKALRSEEEEKNSRLIWCFCPDTCWDSFFFSSAVEIRKNSQLISININSTLPADSYSLQPGD